MAEEFFSQISTVLAALKEKPGEKGIANSSAVVKSGSTENIQDLLKVNPTLSSNEKARYTNIFKIMKDVLFPPEEARALEGTKAGKVVKLDKIVEKKEEEKGGASWKLLAALGIAAAAAMLFDKLGPIGVFLTKTIAKIKTVFEIVRRSFTTVSSLIDSLRQSKWGTKISSWIKGLANLPFKVFDKIKDAFKGSKLITNFLEGFGAGASLAGKVAKSIKAVGGTFLSIMKTVLKGIGGPLLKTLKFLPYIGGVVGLGFAYARFKKGDYIAGTFELISAILDFIPGGSIASALIDGGLLLYDLYTAKQEKNRKEGKQEQGFLEYMKDLIGDKVAAALPYLPGIGAIFEIGNAVGAFKSGNIVGGLKFLGRGLLAFVGGKGLADIVSSGIGFVVGLFDNKKEDSAVVSKLNEGESWTDILAKIWKKANEVIGEKLKQLKDWALEKLDPRNWFGSDDEERIKGEAKKLTDDQKRARARAAGWNTWDEYRISGWKWKTENTQTTADALQINSELVSLSKLQVNLLTSINKGIELLVQKPVAGNNVIANTPNNNGRARELELGNDFNINMGIPSIPI